MANHCPFLLSKRCKQMQDERVYIRAKLGDNEGYAVCHQAADKVNVATEPVQLGDCHWAPLAPCFAQCRCKLRTPLQGVGALAGLHLNEDAAKRGALSLREANQGLLLSFQAEARAALLWCGDANVAILPFPGSYIIYIDDEATRLMGEAFDAACKGLRDAGQPALVREIIAKRITEAAKNDERDPVRPRAAGLAALGYDREVI
jgi:hypothetical protein